jgi:glutamyl-tRNA(Gln) amidotransferase subunit D
LSDSSSGYRGAGVKLLSRYSVGVGDSVEVAMEDGELVGVLMPRYESASEDYIVIKLKSGYNTGIQVAKRSSYCGRQGRKGFC